MGRYAKWLEISLTAVAIAVGFGGAGAESQAALITVSAGVGGSPTGDVLINFNSLTPGSSAPENVGYGVTVSFTPDGKAVVGNLSGIYAAPYLSAGNGLPFGDTLFAGQTQSVYLTSGSTPDSANVTLTFDTPQFYLGLLWGSVDDYNTLEFFDAGGALLGTIDGLDVTASANGDQGVNGTYYVNINSDLAFSKVVAKSANYAFEFDNVALNSPVPEPASLAIWGALGLAGIVATRRRKLA